MQTTAAIAFVPVAAGPRQWSTAPRASFLPARQPARRQRIQLRAVAQEQSG